VECRRAGRVRIVHVRTSGARQGADAAATAARTGQRIPRDLLIAACSRYDM
jgi:hypothetical protein